MFMPVPILVRFFFAHVAWSPPLELEAAKPRAMDPTGLAGRHLADLVAGARRPRHLPIE